MNKKYVWLFAILGLIILIVSLLGFYTYSYLGYKEYRNALREINKLEGDGKKNALSQLYQSSFKDMQGGIIGFVDKENERVLLWTDNGPKIVKLNDKVDLFSYRVCSDENRKSYASNIGFTIFRSLELRKEWYKLATRGAYLVLVNDESGKLSEARVSDSWMFLPMDLNKLCRNN